MILVVILRAKHTSAQAFLDGFQWQFQNGGLFVPTRTDLQLGDQVVVDVRFPELRTHTLVRSNVAWRRPARHGSRLRAGIGVEFLTSEHRKREYLLALARGEIVDMAHRRHRRLPVDLKIGWRSKDEASNVDGELEDIAERGAFIRTNDFRPVGSVVFVEMLPPGSQVPVTIEGRVVRTHHTPGEEGIGVNFRCRDAGGARRLKELIRRLEDPPGRVGVAG